MKIKEIYYKNFGSYGNKIQHLKFDNNGDLFLILPNGH